MSNKCRAFSKSKLGLEPPDNRQAFYAGWDAAQMSELEAENAVLRKLLERAKGHVLDAIDAARKE